MATYYEILGVSKDASLEDLKKAYREQIALHRFDKGKNAAEAFDSIKEAFLVLADDNKRRMYDLNLTREERKNASKERAAAKAEEEKKEEVKPEEKKVTKPEEKKEVIREVKKAEPEEELPIIIDDEIVIIDDSEDIPEENTPIPDEPLWEDDYDDYDYQEEQQPEVEKPKVVATPPPTRRRLTEKEIYDEEVPEVRHRKKRNAWWLLLLLVIIVSACIFIFYKYDDSSNGIAADDTEVPGFSNQDIKENSLSFIQWDLEPGDEGGYYVISMGDKIYSVANAKLNDFLADKSDVKVLSKDDRYFYLYNLLKKTDPLFDLSFDNFTQRMNDRDYRFYIHEKIRRIDPAYEISFQQFDKGIGSPVDDVMRYYVNTKNNRIELLPERFAEQYSFYQPQHKSGEKETTVVPQTPKPAETVATVLPSKPEPKPVETPKPEPEVRPAARLNTGTSPFGSHYGSGMYSSGSGNRITITNNSGMDAVIIITDAYTGDHVRDVYVRAGDSYIARDIPEGDLRVKTNYGNDWNPGMENGGRTPKGGFKSGSRFTSSTTSGGSIHLNGSDGGSISKNDFFY